MSLRFAILALLSVEPMTGYDLAKRFESSVASDGVITEFADLSGVAEDGS